MNEATIIESSNAVAIYSGGLDAVLNDLAKEARSIVSDISTDRGRKEIASIAYKVARSKTLLDDMGKKLGEEAKAKLDAINADRRKARDFCDALKDDVRRPLTEWEDADKRRVASHEANILEIVGAGNASINEWMNISAQAMRERLAEIESERTLLKWEEFSARAETAINEASEKIKQAIANREKYDAEQAELERLRAEDDRRQKLKAEQERIEREERIKAEAAEAARKAAEAKAAAEAAAAKAAADAALAAQTAIAEKARKDAAEASARAEREKLAAIEAEKKRAADAAKAEADAAAKREQDKKHKAKINNEAVAALMAEGLAEDVAKIVVSAIARGLVPNVRIAY